MSAGRRRTRSEDGSIAIVAGVLAGAVVLAGALALDVGRVAYVSRDQQGATDRAALDSVSALRGEDNEASEETLTTAHEEAVRSLERNPAPGTQEERALYRVDLGRAQDPAATEFELVCGGYFDADDEPTNRGALASAGWLRPDDDDSGSGARVQSSPPECDGGVAGQHVDAVRLWTYGRVDYVLAIGGSGTDLHKIASARSTPPTPPTDECPEGDPDCPIPDTFVPRGTISAGSTLATMEDGVLNQVLSELVGGSVTADLAGYQGVAAGRVRLGDLAATDELAVGTVDELLSTDVSALDLIEATAAVLEADGDAVAAELAAELEGLSAAAGGTLDPIRLGHDDEHLGGLALATGSGSGADVRVDAVELVLASLQIANRDHALELELSVFGETVPVTMTVVEPPVIAAGYPGRDGDGNWLTLAETAQIDLDLTVDLDELVDANSELESDLDPVLDDLTDVLGDLLGLLGLDDDDVDLGALDLTVRAAEGASGLGEVRCEDDGGLTTDTTVTTARVRADADGEVFEVFEVEDDVLRLDDGARLTLGESAAEETDFPGPLPTGPERVPEGGAPPDLSLSAGELVGTGDLDDLDALLDPVTDLLDVSLLGDEGIVAEVLDQLGLDLGSVDVLAHDIDCTRRSLQPSVASD